jgi:Cu/Ag efflux protein CusF
MTLRAKWIPGILVLVALAVLVSPALAAEAKGKIKSVTADQDRFVVTSDDGKDLTFQMGKDAKIQLNNRDSRLRDLKVGDQVRVTYQEQGGQMIVSEVRSTRKD